MLLWIIKEPIVFKYVCGISTLQFDVLCKAAMIIMIGFVGVYFEKENLFFFLPSVLLCEIKCVGNHFSFLQVLWESYLG